MKYFSVVANFKENLVMDDNFKSLVKEHQDFIDKGIADKVILLAGPSPAGGGVIILKAESLEAAKKLFEAEPFHIHGINNYSFKEFTKYNCQDEVGFWFE